MLPLIITTPYLKAATVLHLVLSYVAIFASTIHDLNAQIVIEHFVWCYREILVVY